DRIMRQRVGLEGCIAMADWLARRSFAPLAVAAVVAAVMAGPLSGGAAAQMPKFKDPAPAAKAPVAPPASPPAAPETPAAPAAPPPDPRAGDPTYEQAQRLMRAIDAILQDAAKNRGDLKKLPSKDDFLVTPLWTETKEQREAKIRALLDAALGIVTD